jgi:hypothetical protein
LVTIFLLGSLVLSDHLKGQLLALEVVPFAFYFKRSEHEFLLAVHVVADHRHARLITARQLDSAGGDEPSTAGL